ncbi:hypothetical protein T492DRAFT_1076029 [Pavlovales sp. CCMP2436]|nr:hypothetical protein T492DRAFT_1076029 [Pavlovales sp. CCMP2436]
MVRVARRTLASEDAKASAEQDNRKARRAAVAAAAAAAAANDPIARAEAGTHPGKSAGGEDNRTARRAAAAATAAAAAAAVAAAHAPQEEGAENGDSEEAGKEAGDGKYEERRVALVEGFDRMSEELWLQVLSSLDGRSLCAAACVCAGLAALANEGDLWHHLHAQLFGDGPFADAERTSPLFFGAPDTLCSSWYGQSERERVVESERHLENWRRVGREAPLQMPLPGMTSVSLLGSVGVSTHADKLVRLWEARSGRRIAAHQHKHELTACAGVAGVAAVGDVTGAVYVSRFVYDDPDALYTRVIYVRCMLR